MKFYRLGYYDWEYTCNNTLYNDLKVYSDTEFKNLCADITCEEIYNHFIENEQFIKEEIENEPNKDEKSLREMYGVELKQIKFEDIHEQVLEKLKLHGFQILIEDVSFIMDSCKTILGDYDGVDEENDLIKERYKLFERKQKLERIVNDK